MWLDYLHRLFSSPKTVPTHPTKSTNNERQEPPTPFDTPVPSDSLLTKRLSNGLLPGEIILLDWLNGKRVNDDIPVYFFYQYQLTNARKTAMDLVSKGFLRPATPENSLNHLKVADLKRILKHHNLKMSGKKADLILRIKTTLTPDTYAEELPNGILQLSPSGQRATTEYADLIEAHKHSDEIVNVENALRTPLEILQEKSAFKKSRAGQTLKNISDIQDWERYTNVATLDKYTCEHCANLDHTIFLTAHVQPGDNLPPFHEGCRCYPEPYLDDLPDISESWYRDPVTNKSEYGHYTTYQEWKADMILKYGPKVF